MPSEPITVAEARAKLEGHFGRSNIPPKYEHLLDWWSRLLSDPNAAPRMRLACERDLDDVVGPIVGAQGPWVMATGGNSTSH